MIEVVVNRNETGLVTAFTVKGHAGYAEEGQDIICAAVSAICYTAVGYFDTKRFDGKDPCYEERDGRMRFRTPDINTQEDLLQAQGVLDAMVIGLQQVEASYGKKFIRVREG
ncbi:MAG: ribosomal-processing cysteine protease Prp [Clostridia bacterium]|nr:ribosomal-processing cysteine protease Prp [Clostridia bacterium]